MNSKISTICIRYKIFYIFNKIPNINILYCMSYMPMKISNIAHKISYAILDIVIGI